MIASLQKHWFWKLRVLKDLLRMCWPDLVAAIFGPKQAPTQTWKSRVELQSRDMSRIGLDVTLYRALTNIVMAMTSRSLGPRIAS